MITGSFKLFQRKEKVIASGGTWAADFDGRIVKLIAGVELLSGFVIIVPRLLGHGYYVTSIAAACIVVIMIGAIFVHLRRKEYQHALINVVFLLMALFVEYEQGHFDLYCPSACINDSRVLVSFLINMA